MQKMGCIASLGGVEPPELPTAEIAAFLQEKGKEGPDAVNKKTEEFKEQIAQLDEGGAVEVKEAKMKLAKNAEEKQIKIAAVKSYCEGVFREQLKGESWGRIEAKLRGELDPKVASLPEAVREKAMATAMGKVQEKHDQQVDKFIDQQEEKMLANVA